MKNTVKLLLVLSLFVVAACSNTKQDDVIISRTFGGQGWEKFSPIYTDIELVGPTTYDLSMKVAFTDEYSDSQFKVVFTVFDSLGVPYRAKSYSYTLKDGDGNWKSERNGQVYEFVLPVNSSLTLSDAGEYRFQLDSRMPVTPVMGIRKIELVNNNK